MDANEKTARCRQIRHGRLASAGLAAFRKTGPGAFHYFAASNSGTVTNW
ncbi:hypothetical protein HMPREF9413_1991 [Paenibacillus sp. HGF7]|nr:hypothetical protein HMPREF9413_1991 [Paenibacillus sp. HGF7]